MAKLRMYWRAKEPLDFLLPQDFECRLFNGSDEDIAGWLDVCKCGIIAPDRSTEEFHRRITDYDNDMRPFEDVFIVTHRGNYAATITAMLHPDSGEGYIHMVAAKPEYRGRGVGNAIVSIGLTKLWQQGCRYATLSTDDFRLAAVKSYITHGFLPVETDENSKTVWSELIGKLGIDKIDILNDKGEFISTVLAKK